MQNISTAHGSLICCMRDGDKSLPARPDSSQPWRSARQDIRDWLFLVKIQAGWRGAGIIALVGIEQAPHDERCRQRQFGHTGFGPKRLLDRTRMYRFCFPTRRNMPRILTSPDKVTTMKHIFVVIKQAWLVFAQFAKMFLFLDIYTTQARVP